MSRIIGVLIYTIVTSFFIGHTVEEFQNKRYFSGGLSALISIALVYVLFIIH